MAALHLNAHPLAWTTVRELLFLDRYHYRFCCKRSDPGLPDREENLRMHVMTPLRKTLKGKYTSTKTKSRCFRIGFLFYSGIEYETSVIC